MNRSVTITNIETRESDTVQSYQLSIWQELAMLRCGLGGFQHYNGTPRLNVATAPQSNYETIGAISLLRGQISCTAKAAISTISRTRFGKVGATTQSGGTK